LGRDSDVRPAGFLRRKILGLQTKCTNESGGCEWTGELRYMAAHLRKDCGMQRAIHVMHSFVTADVSRAADEASASSAGDAADSSYTPDLAASELDSFLHHSLLQSLSLAALKHLASCAPSAHHPAPGETVPHAGLESSFVLQAYWASTMQQPPSCVLA